MEKPVVTIDRRWWRSGGDRSSGTPNENISGWGSTYLRNSDGYMCCLGFVCMQLGGYSEMAITTFEAPSELPDVVEGFTAPDEHNFFRHTELSNYAITINDDGGYTREEREEALISTFKDHGIGLEFVGEYLEEPPADEAGD